MDKTILEFNKCLKCGSFHEYLGSSLCEDCFRKETSNMKEIKIVKEQKMSNYNFQDYVNLGIYPEVDKKNNLQFSKANIDFIIEKYLKTKKQFDEFKTKQEAIEDINCSQFNFARANAEYYKHEVKVLKEELKDLKLLNRRYDKFQEINAGLKRECKRYKEEQIQFNQQITELKQRIEMLQNGIVDDETLGILVEESSIFKELKAENERLKTCKCCECQSENEYHLRGIISDLEQQLKEKDEELNRYAELFDMKDKDFYVIEKAEYEKMKAGAKEIVKQSVKDNTKQVCEKIRKEIKQLEQNIDNNPCFLNKEYKLELKRKSIYKNIFKILDQIEKEGGGNNGNQTNIN